MSGELEALCLTEDGDWDGVANRIGGRLVNRETRPGADPGTFPLIPATGNPDVGALTAATALSAAAQDARSGPAESTGPQSARCSETK
jgi:hypothetical protein